MKKKGTGTDVLSRKFSEAKSGSSSDIGVGKRVSSFRNYNGGIDCSDSGKFNHKGLLAENRYKGREKSDWNESSKEEKSLELIKKWKNEEEYFQKKAKYHVAKLLRMKVQRKFGGRIAVCTCGTTSIATVNKNHIGGYADLYLSSKTANWGGLATCKFAFCVDCGPRLVEKRTRVILAGLLAAEEKGYPMFFHTNTLKRSECIETQDILLGKGRRAIRAKLKPEFKKRGWDYAYYVGKDPTFDLRNVKGDVFHLHNHGNIVPFPLPYRKEMDAKYPELPVPCLIDRTEREVIVRGSVPPHHKKGLSGFSTLKMDRKIAPVPFFVQVDKWVSDAWCRNTGASPLGQNLQPIRSVAGTAKYIPKAAGAALEVSASVLKSGKKGLSLPQLIDEVLKGNDAAIPPYQKFMNAMGGKKSVSPSRNWGALSTDTLFEAELEKEPCEPVLSVNSLWFDIVRPRLREIGFFIWKNKYVDHCGAALQDFEILMDETKEDLLSGYPCLRPPVGYFAIPDFIEENGPFVWKGCIYSLDKNRDYKKKDILRYAFNEWYEAYFDPVLNESILNIDSYLNDRLIFGSFD